MEVQDIEKIKRINALTRELLEHGIASNMEEAAEQARQMIERGQTLDMQRPQIEIKPASSDSVSSRPLGMGLLGFDELKQRMDTVEQQMGEMLGKLNEIVAEINRIQKPKHESQERSSSPITMEEPKNVQQSHLKDEKVEPHPRTGKYNPDDVAIEKMFYFGGGGRR